MSDPENATAEKRTHHRKSANPSLDEVSPRKERKYRKKSNAQFSTHGSINDAQMYVSVKTKAVRTEFKISAPNDSVKLLRKSNRWNLIYKDKICKVVSAYADQDSDFVSVGQLIFELILYNGQKIRIEKGDLNPRRVGAISKAMNRALKR